MGLFDLRCAISGLSTTFWPPYEDDAPRRERSTCAMFLLEEIDGHLTPWTPPVSGTYDRYGRIELWPQDHTDYTRWIEARLVALAHDGLLVSSWQDELDRARTVEEFLKHGSQTAFNAVELAIDGRRACACIVLDQVAAAIHADDPSPVLTVADACTMFFPEGGAGRKYFSEAPASSLPQLARYASVSRFVGAAGFSPIREGDGTQQTPDDVRRYAHAAWERGGSIARHVAKYKPDWTARWQKSRAESEERARALTAEPKPYSARAEFAKGDVVTHPTFGTGLVEELVGNDKIRVRFGKQDKTLVHNRR